MEVILSSNLIDRITDDTYRFKLFTLAGCKFCEDIEKVLWDNEDKLGYKKYLAKYEVINEDDNVSTFFKNLKLASDKGVISNFDSSHKTFPVVFDGSKFIGGSDDTIKALKL